MHKPTMHLLINLFCVTVLCDRTQYLERDFHAKSSMCEWKIQSTPDTQTLESSLYFPTGDACEGDVELTGGGVELTGELEQLQKKIEKVIIAFQHEDGSPCACQSDGQWLFHYIKDEAQERDCSRRTCAKLAIYSLKPERVTKQMCSQEQCPTPAGALLLSPLLQEPDGVTWGTPCDAQFGHHPEKMEEVKENDAPETVQAPNNEALIAVLKKNL